MRQKDSVRAFKNELRNYEIYRREVTKFELEVEELYDRLGGGRGIDPSKEPLHAMPNKDLEYQLRDRISNLEAKINVRKAKLNQTDEILSRMETTLKQALFEVYAKGKTVDALAIRLEVSPSGLVKRFNKAIERALR